MIKLQTNIIVKLISGLFSLLFIWLFSCLINGAIYYAVVITKQHHSLTNVFYDSLAFIFQRNLLLSHQLPILLSLSLIAVIDGLSQRAIRRYNMARESALTYQQAKSCCWLTLASSLFVALLPLISRQVLMPLLPVLIIVFSVLLQRSCMYFKKYL